MLTFESLDAGSMIDLLDILATPRMPNICVISSKYAGQSFDPNNDLLM